MLKVLLVDDELLTRKTLRELIDWKAEGFVIVGEASNGVQALELTRALQPEVILLDIKMPQMGGVEFMSKIITENFSASVLVLSSHEDFHFAKKAIEYGAFDYLLKHQLTTEKLVHSLTRIKQSIHEKKSKQEQFKQLNERLVKFEVYEKDLMLREIIDGVTSERFAEITKNTQLDLGVDGCCVVAIQTYASGKETPWKVVGESLRSVLRRFSGGEFYIKDASTLIVLINSPYDQNLFLQLKTHMEIYSELYEKALEIIALPFSFSVGKQIDQIEALPESIERTLDICKYRFFMKKETIIYWQQIDQARGVDKIEVDNLFSKLEYAVNNVDDKEVHAVLGRLTSLLEAGMDFDAYEYSLSKANNIVEQILRDQKLDRVLSLGDYVLTASYDKLEHVHRDFSHKLELLITQIENKRHYSNPIIFHAIQYIKENYSRNITLTMIAEAINVSRTYLSFLFKEETGQTLVNFISNYRIEKAKDLIGKDHMRVQEAAFATGFSDAKYFSRIFKKYTGITPSEYRNAGNT